MEWETGLHLEAFSCRCLPSFLPGSILLCSSVYAGDNCLNSTLCHRPEFAQAKPVDRLAMVHMILSTDKISPRSRRELLSCDEGNHQLILSGQGMVSKSSFCMEGFASSL